MPLSLPFPTRFLVFYTVEVPPCLLPLLLLPFPPIFVCFPLVFLFFPVLFGFCRVPRDRANDSSQCFRGVARRLIALVVFLKAFRLLGQVLG